jgi:serine/threonine protein kinase
MQGVPRRTGQVSMLVHSCQLCCLGRFSSQQPPLLMLSPTDCVSPLLRFVLELLSGQSYRDLMSESGPDNDLTACTMLSELLDAIDAIHDNNLVHGDIKVQMCPPLSFPSASPS